MIQKTVKDYILIGTCVRFLQDVKKGYKIHGDRCVIGNINKLLNEFDNLGLNVTKRAAKLLIKNRDELEAMDKNFVLTEIGAKKLKIIMTDLRKTLEAESEGLNVLLVTDAGKKYTIERFSTIGDIFDAGVFVRLSDIAQYDFSEAGQCIIYNRPTAAAFHILRGTEDVIKLYYLSFLPPPAHFKTWVQITTDLKGITTGIIPDRIIVDHLHNIGQNFRNPTQHPNKRYDIEEVQNLLGVCFEVINRIIKILYPI